MEKYALSVIVPAYNCEETISQTLDSILSQKSKDLEIIIVNDGSTDNTEKICLEYCSKNPNVKYFKKSNSGVSETRNLGIEKSVGEYIAFLDSDDVWDLKYYDDDLCNRLKTSEYDILVFSSCFSDMNLNIVEYVGVKDEILVSQKDKAVDRYYHSFCSFIFKTKFLKSNNLCFNSNLRYGEDELFRSQCLYLANKILAQDKLSFYYRNNVNSATKMNRKQKLFAKQKLKAYYLMKEFFFEQYERNSEELFIKNSRTVSYFAHAIRLLSEIGYGYGKIKKICTEENICLLYENIGKYYDLYYVDRDILKNYIESPFTFYFKNRFHGLWFYSAVGFKHWLMRLKKR